VLLLAELHSVFRDFSDLGIEGSICSSEPVCHGDGASRVV
jgi:hypothetical protein